MKYLALKSFSGNVTMTAGEIRELDNPAIVKDLKRAGYITEHKETQKRRTRKNGGVKNVD